MASRSDAPSCAVSPILMCFDGRISIREGKNINSPGAGAGQDPCAGRHRGPGCQDIVNNYDPLAVNSLLLPVWDFKGAPDIHDSLPCAEPNLLPRALAPHQDLRSARHSRRRGDYLGKIRRLVESATPHPHPVQGHRNQNTRLIQKFGTGSGHPPSHWFRKIASPGIFQTMDE